MIDLRSSRRCPALRGRGLTLIEMAISIILVSVMLAVALKTVGASKVSQRTLSDRRIGSQLAQGLMTEILEQDYADGAFGPDSFGLNPEEATTGDRSLFDDVDDYDGWTASPPQHKDGTEMAGRSGWRRTVAVHWVKPTDFSTVVFANQGVKRIVVVVSRDNVPVAQLQAIRTSGLPEVEACCFLDETCLVTDADSCLALGGWPQGENSDCYSSTCCVPAVVFEGLTEVLLSSPVMSAMLGTPAGTGQDDLLIAVVVVDEDVSITPPPAGGWTLIGQPSHPGTSLTIGVWWKLANAFEPGPHVFDWTDEGIAGKCYAWMMRFTGHSTTNTIHATSFSTGQSDSPLCPAVITSIDHCMILRVGGFEHRDVTPGVPGLGGHAAITMAEADGCSGGAGSMQQVTAGDSGTAAFALTANEEFITFTIAVPAEDCQ